MSLFANFRIFYSRQFIFMSFIINNVFCCVLFLIKANETKRKFILLYSDNSDREYELKLHGIDFINDIQEYDNGIEGIVLKDISILDGETAKRLAIGLFKGLKIYSFAELYASITGKIPLESFMPELFRADSGKLIYSGLKRSFEYILCLLLLIPFFIAGLIISLFIIIDDGLPVFFIQDRVGYKGKIFRLIKFRTMKKNAEANGAAFASNNDHRITRVGKLIRKFRLDELPQILNVIKGDMSLIGPRPEQIPFARKFENEIPFYSLRYNNKPGLTGWAQIHSGYAANNDQTREKLEYDLYYIFNQSVTLDLIIIFKTIKIILTGYGAI